MMGTGGAVRERGGWEIMRACEAILALEMQRSGRRELPLASAHATTAGALDCKVLIHCVASGAQHASSAAVVRRCVENALLRAQDQGCRTVAMPLFGTGHARLKIETAVDAMLDALLESKAPIERVQIVVDNAEKANAARAILIARGVAASPV